MHKGVIDIALDEYFMDKYIVITYSDGESHSGFVKCIKIVYDRVYLRLWEHNEWLGVEEGSYSFTEHVV